MAMSRQEVHEEVHLDTCERKAKAARGGEDVVSVKASANPTKSSENGPVELF
jgi:hypothetical protein